MQFTEADLAIFIVYILFIVGLGLWVSRDKKGHEKDSKDYFLAGKSLPWWAIGASLIAANISAAGTYRYRNWALRVPAGGRGCG